MKPTPTHVIDWDKVKSIGDVKQILMGLNISIDITRISEESKLKKYLIKIEQ
jgi:hypothetical protein